MLIKDDNNDLDNIKFINGIISLIEKDKYHIFEIFSDNEKEKEEFEEKKIFLKLIKKIFEKIEKQFDILVHNKKAAELLNSLLLLMKLFGEYNNIKFHKIVCENLNEKINDIEYIIIIKLFYFYELLIKFFKSSIVSIEYIMDYGNYFIIFHSLIQCIIEYININDDSKEKITKILNDIIDEEDELQKIFLDQVINLYLNQIDENGEVKKFINELFNLIFKREVESSEEKIKNKCSFFLNTMTLFDIYRVKNLKFTKNKNFLIKKTLKMMEIFFTGMVIDNEIITINLKYTIDKIDEESKCLFDIYKKDNFYNNQAFYSILLNYQLVFQLTKIPEFEEMNYFFYINNEKANFENALKFLDNNFFLVSNRILLLLFSFLQKIHDIIEIRLTKDKNILLLNTILPENFNLGKYSYSYFENFINYADRESKLLSIYSYIDCLRNEMKETKKLKIPLHNWINFRFLEAVNYLAIFIENIFFTKFYSKSRNVSFEEYNLINNRQNFSKTSLIIHLVIDTCIIIIWSFTRFKIEKSYSFVKVRIKNLKRITLTYDEKVEQLKRKNSKSKANNSENFILNKIKSIGNWILKIVYTLKIIYPFIITLICLIIFLCGVQLGLIIPLLLLFNLFDNLLGIIKALLEQFYTLLQLGLYMMIIIYFFSWLGFFYIPKMFKYEPVDKNNEVIENEEYICSSAISCILYFWNFGMTSEGSVEMNLISFKNNTNYYLGQFFFDLLLYTSIHMIFFNVVLATITDSFGKMRDQIKDKEDDIKNSCFICQKTKNDCVNDFEDFDEHLQNHDKWKYIILICNILEKDIKELTDEEYFIYRKITEKKINWFPKNKKQNSLKKTINELKELIIQKINNIKKN